MPDTIPTDMPHSIASLDRRCLNVATIDRLSTVNGPGVRFAIWLQGCRLGCPGCVNREMQPEVIRQSWPVDALAQGILATRGIEGVTYTGGEPTLQAEGLVRLSEQLRPAGLSIVCYSGHTREELEQSGDPWLLRLLACADILIDGPYVAAAAASLLWRGSRNQRVHFLTDRYGDWASRLESAAAQVQINVGDQSFRTSGNWPGGFLEDLERALCKGDVPEPN